MPAESKRLQMAPPTRPTTLGGRWTSVRGVLVETALDEHSQAAAIFRARSRARRRSSLWSDDSGPFSNCRSIRCASRGCRFPALSHRPSCNPHARRPSGPVWAPEPPSAGKSSGWQVPDRTRHPSSLTTVGQALPRRRRARSGPHLRPRIASNHVAHRGHSARGSGLRARRVLARRRHRGGRRRSGRECVRVRGLARIGVSCRPRRLSPEPSRPSTASDAPPSR